MEDKVRAALYARVSTDFQEREKTIQSQVEELLKWANDRGYDVMKSYTDEGYSGATLQRPGLDCLRDDARSGQFDLVLFHSPDRLARKAIYQGIVLEELEKAGIKVEFLNYPVDNSPEGKMLLGMQGLFAGYERAKIAERSRRGRLHKARQGALMGGYVPYGYRYIARDKGTNGMAKLEIDEIRAAVARDMYQWLIEEKLSCRQIAGRLNTLGVPTPRGGKHWTGGTVNRILKQEVYFGIFYYHRAEAVEPAFRRKAGSAYKHRPSGRKLRPKEEWIGIPVPAIIDRPTWEAAQRQLRENFIHSPRHNIVYRYLLRGLVKCACCGMTWSGTSHQRRRYYEHNRGNYPGATDIKCPMRSIRAEPLEEVVWQAVTDALRQPDVLKAEYKRRLAEAGNPDAADIERRQLELALKRIKLQQDRLTDAYLSEAIEMPQFKAKMDEIRSHQNQLERQLADLSKTMKQRHQAHEALACLDAFCDTVNDGVDSLTFEEKQQLLRLVVEQVMVEDNKVRIEAIIPLTDSFRDKFRLRLQSMDTLG